ncbi:MAG: glycoside hydrolase family 127 protein [Lachnospiraceae bacterium]|nr:glycoside hydrolase family 127 protein [Lachnospiraceae bacterium]
MNAKAHCTLKKGVLGEAYEKLLKNFYNIDPKVHAEVYRGYHELIWDEPEFAGKYLDLCATYYEQERDIRALENAAVVVDGIARYQWESGYLGALEPGHETEVFGVWSTAFTIYGLLSYERAVSAGKEAAEAFRKSADQALVCAQKAGDWIVESFIGGPAAGKEDILNGGNGGSQHITAILALVPLYERCKNPRVKEFLLWLLHYLEGTDMDVVNFEDLMKLRSRKGIEMITVYLGLIEWGVSQKDGRAIDAARRYWKQLWETQIRNTGCGTVSEWWTEGGNGAMILPTDTKPNENCVAVGWAELTLALMFLEPKAEYGDALERTLFNHMLGSLSPDGTDFAYYQGNVGQKVYRTERGLYQCCRYRGYVLFSNLPRAAYCRHENQVIPVFYASSEYQSEDLVIRQTTDWPRHSEVSFECLPAQNASFTLMLRIPGWAKEGFVEVMPEGEAGFCATAEPGFYPVEICKKTIVRLTVPFSVRMNREKIGEEEYAEMHYGPVLMAADTRFGTPLSEVVIRPGDELRFVRCDSQENVMLCLEKDNGKTRVTDYASAGGKNPAQDEFAVWMRTEK